MRKAVNIVWDCKEDAEGNYPELPETVAIPEGIADDEVTDYLSDNYGWCVYAYSLEEDETKDDAETKAERLPIQEKEVTDVDTLSVKCVVDTLRAIKYGYSGYSIKDDRLEGAYILASELTGLSIDALNEMVLKCD